MRRNARELFNVQVAHFDKYNSFSTQWHDKTLRPLAPAVHSYVTATVHSCDRTHIAVHHAGICTLKVKVKGSPYSIAERRVPEMIPVLDSQSAGDVSHKPDGRQPLLSARPAITPATLRGLLPVSLLGEHRHDGCEQFA